MSLNASWQAPTIRWKLFSTPSTRSANCERKEGGGIQGRLTAKEENLLRVAIVFTGGGLDATLKQLIRDTLPRLLEANSQAHEKLEAFAADRLGTAEIADTRTIARYLTSASPRQRLIEDYIYEMTGSSLQSADEVQKVAGALGIDDKETRKQIKELRPLFIARNEISHELDLQSPEKPGDRSQRTRSISVTKTVCDSGFAVCQLIVNSVGEEL
jgi:hypothetical protein